MKRLMTHQFPYAAAFIDAGALDLDHHLAGQHLGRLARKGGAAFADMRTQTIGVFGRLAVMQRDRIALVLKFDAGRRVGRGSNRVSIASGKKRARKYDRP